VYKRALLCVLPKYLYFFGLGLFQGSSFTVFLRIVSSQSCGYVNGQEEIKALDLGPIIKPCFDYLGYKTDSGMTTEYLFTGRSLSSE